jgi:hypothetical protein
MQQTRRYDIFTVNLPYSLPLAGRVREGGKMFADDFPHRRHPQLVFRKLRHNLVFFVNF